MTTWSLNLLALGVAIALVAWLALSLFWRISLWRAPKAAMLNQDYGLPTGVQAPEIAAHFGTEDAHLGFLGRRTLVVFGASGCGPCEELLLAAASHPATRGLRLVYVSDSDVDDVDNATQVWEVYRFHNEAKARIQWNAPVSPYVHVIDGDGTVMAKGIASRVEHLDRLLGLEPMRLRPARQPIP